ncbi:MAG: hypothetical protein QG567_765 [Campylobacterota bacterium]|nr:hypothetical protein [Campylobacterota bacterium]
MKSYSNKSITIAQLQNILNGDVHPDDYEMAKMVAEHLFLFTEKFYGNYFISPMNYSIYQRSHFETSPLSQFSQKVKNRLFKKFIKELSMRGYITLRCLELMQEFFDLAYTLEGPQLPTELHHAEQFIFIKLSSSYFAVNLENITEFFSIICSDSYLRLLDKNLPAFIEDYNKEYSKQKQFKHSDIELLVRHIDISNKQQVFRYIYAEPDFFTYVQNNHPRLDKKYWIDFLKYFKCSLVHKRHEKKIDFIFSSVIKSYFFNDEEFFDFVIQTESISHFAIYFSNSLKRKLRSDFNLAITCYKNCCVKHRKELKKILGTKVTSTQQFKYLFGVNQ